jgi:hypothetical protein
MPTSCSSRLSVLITKEPADFVLFEIDVFFSRLLILVAAPHFHISLLPNFMGKKNNSPCIATLSDFYLKFYFPLKRKN